MLAAVVVWGYGLAEVVIGLLILLGVVAIFWLVVTKGMGYTIPDWVRQAFWIVLAVIIGVVLIKILVSL